MSPISHYKVGEKAKTDCLRVALTDKSLQYVDVSAGDRVRVLDCGESVLVVPASHRSLTTVLAEYGVSGSSGSLQTNLFTPALAPLDVSPGDRVETFNQPVGIEVARRDPK